jgi:hypothetical protein
MHMDIKPFLNDGQIRAGRLVRRDLLLVLDSFLDW